ncbi:MAG: FliM/FliN family flagellar motor switch protein [Paracoccaceae bacterium]
MVKTILGPWIGSSGRQIRRERIRDGMEANEKTIRKMIAVAQDGGSGFGARLGASFDTALGKLCRDLFDVSAALKDQEQGELSREQILQAAPAPGLLVACRAPDGQTGLVGMDPMLVNAVVELTTGADEKSVCREARTPTAIDAALCREFFSGFLSIYPAEILQDAGFEALPPLEYLRHECDSAKLAYVLAETTYRQLSGTVSLQGGVRGGRLSLSLPKGMWRSEKRPQANNDTQGWSRQFRENVLNAPLTLRADLDPIRFALGAALGLQPGDNVPLVPEALSEVDLVTDSGIGLFAGRLGQSAGKKAIVLTAPSPPALRQPEVVAPAPVARLSDVEADIPGERPPGDATFLPGEFQEAGLASSDQMEPSGDGMSSLPMADIGD